MDPLNPFYPAKRNGYWILVDGRSGRIASYPTNRAQCEAEVRIMNRAYREVNNLKEEQRA